MIFKRFLSRGTSNRRLPPDQDALIEIARADQDTARRMDACRRISRLGELRRLVETDRDAGIREIALARYRRLLCGAEQGGPSTTERAAEIGLVGDQRILAQVAAEAAEPEVRLAAIEHLEDQTALAVCALEDAITANRSAAAERLQDRQALERVSRRIGKRDKTVYRIVRHRLKEIAEREALPERVRGQCADLCERLERLGRFASWAQDRGLLDLLDRQWADIEPQADEAWRARYRTGRERFLAAYAAYRREHEAQVAVEEAREAGGEAREALIEALAGCRSIVDEALLGNLLRDTEARWDALEPLDDQALWPLAQRYREARQAAEARLAALRQRREAGARLDGLVAQARSLLQQSRPLERERAAGLLEDGGVQCGIEGVDASAVAAFQEARGRLEARLRKQIRHAEQRLEESGAKLAELEGALECGELRRAEPLFQSLQAALELGESSGLPRKRLVRLRDALRGFAPRLRELQRWRKFGADTHREGLCQAMEALVTEDTSLEARVLRLHDLQSEWKTLDKGGAPANDSLWGRFYAASEKVYECCRPYLEEQAAGREAARAEREALCEQLERFLDQVDWDRIDWKQAVRAEREMRRGWAAMGAVGGRQRRALEKRFRTAIARLDERLAAERLANQELKRDLIARVESLIEEQDLHWAIQETKRLQGEWHTTVAARQRDENQLWQRFRAACDGVFARRREQQEAHTTELEEHLRAREAICAEAESLAGLDEEPAAFEDALRTIDERWSDAQALPVPNRMAGGLNQRWREARARALARHRELIEREHHAALDLLARQAAVCENLERAIETGPAGGDAVAAEAAWEALPVQRDADLQARIETRFRAALDAFEQGGDRFRPALADNAVRRGELCLRLEILAQLESPPELTRERLAVQVDRLKEHMREGERDPLSSASSLIEEWYLCGPAPAELATALQARFERARAALEQGDQETEAA
jgi:hypothetical protein